MSERLEMDVTLTPRWWLIPVRNALLYPCYVIGSERLARWIIRRTAPTLLRYGLKPVKVEMR